MLTYLDFLRNAADYVDVNSVPGHVKKAAFQAYQRVPASAAFLLSVYDDTASEEVKIACELIGANIIKSAGFFNMLGNAFTALEVGSEVKGAYSKHLKSPLHSTVYQGKVPDLPEPPELPKMPEGGNA